jgi:hypothetical protein
MLSITMRGSLRYLSAVGQFQKENETNHGLAPFANSARAKSLPPPRVLLFAWLITKLAL